ncbi:COG complex component [Lenzites betulinus]|nr:COG complex component [Lenzites betulinus]
MNVVKSPDDSARDPYELDRLAEELVARETYRASHRQPQSSGVDANYEASEVERALPLYVPLSHDDTYLSAPVFDVEQFLLSRAYTSLPDLRAELRDYLAALKEELVKLINDDYEAFISLSTDLRGEGTRLESLKRPLGDLKAHVLESRQTLQDIQNETKQKLDRRAAIREEKAFLHSLLKISESITRLESLLLISSPGDEEKDQSNLGGLPMTSRTDTEGDDRSRGNRAKHIARVAAEYTQLLYHVSRANAEPCAFIDESQWRVDRIKSTLSFDLDHLFAATLSALVGGKDHGGKTSRISETEKSKLYADATECLRTYDMLGLWRDAEDVIRREVLRDFIKKTLYPGALSAPRSPIVPHTPFAPSGRPHSPGPPQTASLPPRTPYTPFTAFASKQNPFEVALRADGSATAGSLASTAILDETDDPLAALYNTILRYVDRDVRRLMEIAEAVCVKSGSRERRSGNTDERPGFDIMANVVWAEVGRALMDELGNVIFAAGSPDDFRKHHETTQAFIRALEFLAPSVRSVEAMRKHIVFASFERRWQLPVYFQLRWKEIVSKLEEALATTRLERATNKTPFVTAQAAAVYDALRACWSAEVFIPELSARFWRFTLQILSRYRTWLDKSLPPLEPPPKVVAAVAAAERVGATAGSAASIRASTPVPAEAASAESIAADEALLQQFATAVTDLKAMEAQTTRLWREELSALLPDASPDDDDNEQRVSPEDALYHSLSKLTSLVPTLLNQIVLILSRRACDALLSMRSIPSQFRAMSTSKRMPTEPSYFVSLIFKHTKAFFGIQSVEGPGAALKDTFLASVATDVFELVTQRYIFFLSAMKKTEESLRRLKKGKKSTYSLFGSSGRDDDGRADEEKIRTQMALDVEAFGREAEALGVVVQENAAYRSLVEMARSSLTEET